MKTYCVYIIANKRNGTLYVGFTSNLKQRIWQHKKKLVEGFSKKYNLDKLIYYEQTEDVISAIAREKQLKKWRRKYKLDLIEKENPEWRDLYEDL